MRWASQRYQMGLAGFGYPWEEGEQAWLLLHQQSRSVSERLLDVAEEEAPSGPSIADLADADSRFITIGKCSVHYNLAVPEVIH